MVLKAQNRYNQQGEHMKTLFYSTKNFEEPYLRKATNCEQTSVAFIEDALSIKTVDKSIGYEVISIFTGDDASSNVLEKLVYHGVRFIAIRAAGYDNIDLDKAHELGLKVANVPEYSPYAIAEHAIALMLCLDRKIIGSNYQVHQHNFTISNLVGFDLHNKNVGIIGVGRIGGVLAKILYGFGCRLVGYDIRPNIELEKAFGLKYVDLPTLCHEANIISMHTCLTPDTRYLINKQTISMMQRGVMLINTSRGGCVNTREVLTALKDGHIGYYGADVYENEKGVFFDDFSQRPFNDLLLGELLALPNVLITPHQAFATREALTNIATTTFSNINNWEQGKINPTEL